MVIINPRNFIIVRELESKAGPRFCLVKSHYTQRLGLPKRAKRRIEPNLKKLEEK